MIHRDFQEPICIYDLRKKGVLMLSLFSAPLFAVMIFETAFFWSLLQLTGILIITFMIGIEILGVLYIYRKSSRIEFFEDYVRAYPKKDKPISASYDRLNLDWQKDRNGNTRCTISIKGRDDASWHVTMYQSRVKHNTVSLDQVQDKRKLKVILTSQVRVLKLFGIASLMPSSAICFVFPCFIAPETQRTAQNILLRILLSE